MILEIHEQGLEHLHLVADLFVNGCSLLRLSFACTDVISQPKAVACDPAFIITNGFLSSPYTSAALVAPSAALAPVAPVTNVAPVAPLASVPAVPYTSVSDYRYSYGSSLTYQDYAPVANSALTLPYTLPYAYAADWYYRK
ncbi:unnamed protein product [Leptidea sinapis]|uniref:Uncharacterized protein n=1 Tax=Leptidea sinapis TaxID=189913 RepID=A0A5E4QU93_9NEOP|nr:unnamed protein product [Leptidea sinapis]